MMVEALLITIVVLALAVLGILIMMLNKSKNNNLGELTKHLQDLERTQEKLEKALKDEIARNREESNSSAKQNREEIGNSFKSLSETLFSSLSSQLKNISGSQKDQLEHFSRNLSSFNDAVTNQFTSFNKTINSQLTNTSQSNNERLDKMRETVAENLKNLQHENMQKLEQMRATVDEKLHATLEKRLGESFKQVSDRLELVHKGLGEMQNLATGVGDLKNILSNVKTRGTWGEIQLGNLLEQVLSAEQYEKNVGIKSNTTERVDFAIKLPGKASAGESPVWLPIDAKFPQEDYQRLIDAHDNANLPAAEEASKQLENRIRLEAKSIKEKYIDPPNTTDFAILFLPIEGLYAEIIRRPGLCEKLQREHRIIIAGPTTLTALLNSLQMGFRTLAIEKRSSEVWTLLAAVKTEFGKFGDILEKTQKKLQEASNTIDTAARKSRTIERKLQNVQELPGVEPETALLENIKN